MLRISEISALNACYAALLGSVMLLAACTSETSDTTAEGAPLSSDTASRPDDEVEATSEEPETPVPDDYMTGDGCLSTSELESQFIALANAARSETRLCGEEDYKASTNLAWNERLEGAALKHSLDMAENRFFDHQGTDGSYVAQRVTAVEYQWRNVGENLAVGQSTMEQVMQDWMESPPHCAVVMNGIYRDIGVSCADNDSQTYSRYWTMVLARPSN